MSGQSQIEIGLPLARMVYLFTKVLRTYTTLTMLSPDGYERTSAAKAIINNRLPSDVASISVYRVTDAALPVPKQEARQNFGAD